MCVCEGGGRKGEGWVGREERWDKSEEGEGTQLLDSNLSLLPTYIKSSSFQHKFSPE